MSRLLPILYSPPMANALWRGRKTETRRLLRNQPISAATYSNQSGIPMNADDWVWPIDHGHTIVSNKPTPPEKWIAKNVAYKVGDRLWVREPWRVGKFLDPIKPSKLTPRKMTTLFEAGGEMSGITPYTSERTASQYSFCIRENEHRVPDWAGKLRPGMYMMPWQSRMTLTVEKVVVERLQSISGASARAEGVSVRQIDMFGADAAQRDAIFVAAYAGLWDSLNAKRAAWATNPWVVAYTFSVRRLNHELCK